VKFLAVQWKFHSFIHFVACLRTGTQLLPKQVLTECYLVLHLSMFRILSFLKIIQCLLTSSSSSSCNFYPSFYLTFTNMLKIRQFLSKMWPIQIFFLLLFYIWYFSLPRLYVILHNFHDRPTNLLQSSPAPNFKTFQVFLIYFPKCRMSAPCKAKLQM
jgi:hypothetical protein